MKRVWALDVLECNFLGYVQGIGGIVQATLRMYRLRVLAPGAVSSNPPPSSVLNPPAARTLVNRRPLTPGLVLHSRSHCDIGPLRAGLNFLHSDCSFQVVRSVLEAAQVSRASLGMSRLRH